MHADLALARRLERSEAHACARFVEARARIEPSLRAEWIEVAGAYAMFDGPGSPITQSFGLGVFIEPSDQDLDRIERFFFDRGAACQFEVSPLAGLPLTRRLVERGYAPVEQSNVLYQPLPRTDRTEPTSIQARPIEPHENDLYARVSLQGWSDYPEYIDYFQTLAPVLAARQDSVSFLAELDGRAIACGALCIHGGVALLAGACTIPEARRQGAQRALLEARLAYAAKRGCDVASVVTEPGSTSQRNAESQGFHVAYTRTKWALDNPAPSSNS